MARTADREQGARTVVSIPVMRQAVATVDLFLANLLPVASINLEVSCTSNSTKFSGHWRISEPDPFRSDFSQCGISPTEILVGRAMIGMTIDGTVHLRVNHPLFQNTS